MLNRLRLVYSDLMENIQKKQNIARKVAGLIRKAESAKSSGTLEEAEAFAKKAQDLMAEYNLQMVDLPDDKSEGSIVTMVYDPREHGRTVKAKRIPWETTLMIVLCDNLNARSLTYKGVNAMLIVGRKMDCRMVINMFTTIAGIFEGEATRYLNGKKRLYSLNHAESRNLKESFFMGACSGLHTAMKKRNEMLKERYAKHELVFSGSDLEEFMEKNFNNNPVEDQPFKEKAYSRDASQQGYACGKGIGSKEIEHKEES